MNQKQAIELYVHLPFCVRKCAYCDFLSFPASEDLRTAYVEALKKEIASVKEEADTSAPIRSLFFGGGTPSILSSSQISELCEQLYDCFDFLPNAEITLEANPGTFDREKALVWKQAGINRISLGVQSFDDGLLRRLGRIHSADDARRQALLLREIGFANLSFDLMMGLPGQSPSVWQSTLKEALSLSPEHLSCYSLIVEEGTPFFADQKEGRLLLPDEEAEREMYHDAVRLLKASGYEQYEISNFARPGFRSIHNTGYWDRVPYFGLGLGAASLVRSEGQELRYRNSSDLSFYLSHCTEPSALHVDCEVLSERDCQEEFMFLGLRKTEGISKNAFFERFGIDIQSVYQAAIEKNLSDGLLLENDDRLYLSEKGTDLGNIVFGAFLQNK